ncbi:3'-5' exonuclease [Luteimonas composti]|uniref:DNA 3'-5' helicase II n=1 Tax=Luteimonas composti TaxID=398257 RepID=A0ABT6MUV7_9GAMM|nr:3'-5' exonuclease [Luteimonas composti]MDH7454392.1 3'-5' exonuclease [Luteimonas composti]
MATLIPSRSTCLPRMTSGERRFSSRLDDKLDDDYLCWYDVPVGPHYRHPDFVVLHPSRGFLVLEVKDWKPDTLAELDRDRAILNTERGRVTQANPLRQARDYAMEIVRLLQDDPALCHPPGDKRAGKLLMPWGFGVVLANITRNQFDQMELEHFLPPGSVICRDEMTEGVDAEEFQKRLWDMFLMPFPCLLGLPQIERVRWHLFPQLRIQVQGDLLSAPSQSEAAPVEIPDIIRVMDLQQEQLARSLGDGHRVIHGVAGSGKTMILGYRCVELARRQHKPVLVLCYNKTLASRLEHLMHGHGVQDRVAVRNFHEWCGEQLKTYGLRKPAFQKGDGAYWQKLVQAVIDGVESKAIPRGQYGAVLIDEGHDFAPEWLRLVAQMVDPETNALLLLYDDAQTLYGSSTQRKFSFASVGIQAQGRTTILRLNYRNTLEVLAVAKAFAEEVLTGQDADDDHVPVIAPESAGRRGPMPELRRARNIWAEADFIAARIRDAIDNGANPNDFAVLCHSNRLSGLIAAQLQKRGLPVLLASDDQRRAMFNGPASVKVMTMHSSKGLEFDTVFIPGICELAAPSDDVDRKRQQVRVLYVAMTRALRQLEMSHHGDGATVEQIRSVVEGVSRRLAA